MYTFLTVTLLSLPVFAKEPPVTSHPPPRPVSTVEHKSLRYSADTKRPGILIATDLASGKPAWELQVYDYYQNPKAPGPLDINFRSLEVDNGKILIEDEGGLEYFVDPEKRSVEILHYPVSLKLLGFQAKPKGWRYRIEVTLSNSFNRDLQIDGMSIANDGDLSNNLFEVSANGKEIEYTGMMKKRGPPKSFIKVKPGASIKSIIEMGDAYPIPAGTAKIKVTFEHRNHFSPDAFDMRSKPLEFELAGKSWNLSPKPKPD